MKKTFAVLMVVGALLLAACGDSNDKAAGPNPNATLRLRGPETGTTVQGNVVTLKVSAQGIHIVKADGDTSGMSGHYHVFIDRSPVQPGAVIPKAANIIHTTVAPIVVTGLAPGTHQLYVVLGD